MVNTKDLVKELHNPLIDANHSHLVKMLRLAAETIEDLEERNRRLKNSVDYYRRKAEEKNEN